MSRPLKTDGSDDELMSPRLQSAVYELDWSYTVRCTNEWSDDDLLSHLCSKAFTIPPRDYNPSAPFVYVRTEDGVVTTLPHGYRIPLLFVAKYQWESIFRTLSLQSRHHWDAGRDEIFHLSRLCHVLFSKARAKAESSGGMEKGWRCVMFDRVLTRFYKGWPVSSPAKLDAFISHFGSREYDRDVLKNDWKRWALKGFFRPPLSSPSIHLSDDDVNNGITAVDFIKRLSKVDNVWTLSTITENNNLKRRPIKFMQSTQDSSSELTDFDLSLDEDEDSNEITNLLVEKPTKRCRNPSEDDDTKNRLGKRAKLEDIIRSLSSLPCSPVVSSRPLGSGDEELDPLPKFKVPRQILHSYGWKRLSATDGLDRRRQREDQEEVDEAGTGTDVLPTCGSDDPSTSTPPSSEQTSLPANPSNSSSVRPCNDTPDQSNEQPTTSPTFLSLPPRWKGKQLESASANPATATATSTSTTTGNTFRRPRKSVHVSLPSSSRMLKQRSKRPVSDPTTTLTLPPRMTREEIGNPSGMTLAARYPLSFSFSEWGADLLNCRGDRTSNSKRDWLRLTVSGEDGGDDDDDDDDMSGKKEKAKTTTKRLQQHSGPLALITKDMEANNDDDDGEQVTSSMITTLEDNNDDDEQGATPAAIPDPPELDLTASLPEPTRSTSYPISSASSSSLSSLSTSVTPSPSDPLVSNSAGVGDAEYGTQQVKDRIRELKTRFMSFRDDLEMIIGRLEVLEGGDDDGSLSDHLNLVSQTEDKRKRKDKESDLDVEMIGVSKSGGGYVDAAVGVDVDALVALRDISVQTVDNTHSLKSKTDESISPPTPFVNTTASNLSTMVDNLVSIKMLSMMQTLVKSNVGGNGNGKAKVVEPSTRTTATTTESDSDLTCQPSPSSTSLSISAASHSMEACDSIMSSLLEEIKTIKQEARYRERSEKEDLLAMRQLHSAEVDVLRRRLSYLESRNLSLGRWDLNNGGGACASGRRKGSRVDDALELDRHHYHHHHRFFEDSGTSRSFRPQQYGDRSQAFQQNGLARYNSSRSASTTIVNTEAGASSTSTTTTPLSSRNTNSLALPPLSITSSTATTDSAISSSSASLPTPTPSDKHDSFGFSKDNNNDHNHYHHGTMGMGMSMDLDDDSMVNLPLPLPLPIKSQRKHHIMALTHAHFS